MKHLTETQLNEYLDGELAGDEQNAAEAHLVACPDCRAALGELRALAAAVESLPEAPLPRDLASLALTQLPPPRLALGWKLVLAAQAGSALGLLLLVVANLLSNLRLPVLSNLPALALPLIQLPLPTFSSLLPPSSFVSHLSSFEILFLAASALLLGGLGNAVLLRGRLEVRK